MWHIALEMRVKIMVWGSGGSGSGANVDDSQIINFLHHPNDELDRYCYCYCYLVYLLMRDQRTAASGDAWHGFRDRRGQVQITNVQ